MNIRQNIGTFDQWLRLSLGFVLLFLAGTGLIGLWGYLGVVPLMTAVVRFCPFYAALGWRTNRTHRHS
jgi:hypothetical protein